MTDVRALFGTKSRSFCCSVRHNLSKVLKLKHQRQNRSPKAWVRSTFANAERARLALYPRGGRPKKWMKPTACIQIFLFGWRGECVRACMRSFGVARRLSLVTARPTKNVQPNSAVCVLDCLRCGNSPICILIRTLAACYFHTSAFLRPARDHIRMPKETHAAVSQGRKPKLFTHI